MSGILRIPASPTGRLAVDIAAGAVAGAVGTLLMAPASKLLDRLLPSQRIEEPARESATEKAARLLVQPIGVRLEGEQKRKAGRAVHWGFGSLCGALYGAARGRVPHASALFGAAFGLSVFIVGDEVMVPLFGLAPGPTQVPARTHFKGLIQHLVYGAATEGASRLLLGSG